jgi:hypothetical protein
MPDDTTADNLDNSLIPAPEGLSEETIPPDEKNTNEQNAVIPNQETENMEAHHHPDLHHETKKFLRLELVDRASLEQLYSFIRLEKADIEIIEYWEQQYRKKAIGLMDLIQKEYHLSE